MGLPETPIYLLISIHNNGAYSAPKNFRRFRILVIPKTLISAMDYFVYVRGTVFSNNFRYLGMQTLAPNEVEDGFWPKSG